MPAQKQPNLNEIAQTFFDLSELEVERNSPPILICPSTDLAYDINSQSLHFYRNGVWRLIDDANPVTGPLAKIIDRFLRDNFPTIAPSTQKITEVKDVIYRRVTHTFSTSKPSPLLTFEDLTLDFKTFTLIPHSPLHFATSVLFFDSARLSEPTPVFDAYLARTFSDPFERDLILDLIAYYLIPFDEEPAFFYFFGPPRTGKSRLMNLIPKIIGDDFTSAFSLQSLTTKDHTVAELSGKKLNALDEDESERIFSDKFKSLLDHSKVEARRLYKAPFSFRPFTKFLFSSNQLPKFQLIEGLERRIHIIKFANVLSVQEQDKRLDDKLEAEIPGIVGKAIEHAKALIARNFEFIDPPSSLEAKDDFLKSVSPVRLFLEEDCLILPSDSDFDSWTPNRELYNAYTHWSRDSGHKVFASQNFHRQVASVPGIIVRRTETERRKNIRLKNPAQGDVPNPSSFPF